MSEDLITHYKAEIANLNAKLKEALDETVKHRKAKSAVQKEYEEFKAKFEVQTKEHEKLKAKLEAAPKELQVELDRLKGEIRTRDHKAKFAEIARELKVKPEALEDLWKLSDYKAEADEIDIEGLKATIQAAVEARPHFIEQEAPKIEPFRPQQLPGGGRGKAGEPATLTANYQQLNDLEWVMANHKSVKEAVKDGRFKAV